MGIAERRLQIYLPEKTYRALRTRARSQRKSMAQVVRESIEHHDETDREKIRKGYQRLWEIVGMVSDGAGLSERHDEFLAKLDRW